MKSAGIQSPDQDSQNASRMLAGAFFRDARRNFRNSLLVSGIAFGTPYLLQPVVDAIATLLHPHWGSASLEQFKKSSRQNSSTATDCAAALGIQSNALDSLLKEVETHSPRYRGRIEEHHTQLKANIVSTVKQYFPNALPKPIENYTTDQEFHELITEKLPKLFAPYRIAVHPHYYDITSEGAPPNFNLNFEIAQIKEYGVSGFELWGSKVKRDVIVLGENYSNIKGSEHRYAIGDWLGLYSGQVFINQDNSLSSLEATRQNAESQVWHSRSSKYKMLLPFIGTEEERNAAHRLLTLCNRTFLGYRHYRNDRGEQPFTLDDLIKEVKIHEYGHGYRHQTLPILKSESPKNRSVTEETFAYAAEVGYAPRLDSVLIDLIEAQYKDSSYEPHIQAKRIVWELMLLEIVRDPTRYGIFERVENKAEAISALPLLFDNNPARVLLSEKIKDQLTERSRPTLQDVTQQMSGFGMIPFGISFFLAAGAVSSIRKGRRMDALVAALDRICELDTGDDEDMEDFLKEFRNTFLKNHLLTNQLRSDLNRIASIGSREAWDAAISFCHEYYRTHVGLFGDTRIFYSISLVDRGEFAAIMLAPALLAHHKDDVFNTEHFEKFFMNIEDAYPFELLNEALDGTNEYFSKYPSPHPDIPSMLYLLPKLKERISSLRKAKHKTRQAP